MDNPVRRGSAVNNCSLFLKKKFQARYYATFFVRLQSCMPEDKVPLLLGLEGARDDAVLSSGQSNPHVGLASILPRRRFGHASVAQAKLEGRYK